MTLKRVFAVLSVVFIVALSVIPTLALKPKGDGHVVEPYEPYYMDIGSGNPFGNLEAVDDYSATNNSFGVYGKSSSGLFGIQYDISRYSGQQVNVTNPYYIYFDYQCELTNFDSWSAPRVFTWFANGKILGSNGSVVGSASSRCGFSIKEKQDSFDILILSDGNIQYGLYKAEVLKSDLITYELSGINGNLLPTYSFRVMIQKEADKLALQMLTTESWTTVSSIILDPSTARFNTMSFGLYDLVQHDSERTIDSSFALRFIRYGSYNEAFEFGYNYGVNDGFTPGFDSGYDEGFADGYSDGKRDGITIGEALGADDFNIVAIIQGVFDTLGELWYNIFNYEIFGVNILGLVGALLVVMVGFGIFALVRKFKL